MFVENISHADRVPGNFVEPKDLWKRWIYFSLICVQVCYNSFPGFFILVKSELKNLKWYCCLLIRVKLQILFL